MVIQEIGFKKLNFRKLVLQQINVKKLYFEKLTFGSGIWDFGR